MIKYTLKCPEDHRFESWFASADAFEGLVASGHVSCAVCGSGGIEKAMMAPRVSSARSSPAPNTPNRPLEAPPDGLEAKIAAFRRHVESTSEYVGPSFASEARAIHEGDSPSRPIYGEASGAEVKSLLEDGVPVAPLPFRPQRKVN